MDKNNEQWIKYAEQRPVTAGIYRWRMPSKAIPGIVVSLLEKFRMRGAGYENVLSPSFDYWDGYRVHVPAELEWQDVELPADFSLNERTRELIVDGLHIDPCPFCKKVPSLRAYQYAAYGGLVVCPSPQNLNSWSLECCSWAKTPSYDDPRKLTETRSAMLRAREQ